MIRIGIAGTGRTQEKFYQANCLGRTLDICAVYDPARGEAEAFAARKRRLTCYDDLEEFASSAGLDAVYIGEPLSRRYEYTKEMLQAGRHVLCEAPLSENRRETEELYELAKKENRVLMEGISSICTPGFQHMKSLLPSLGTIRRVTFQDCRAMIRPDLSAGACLERGYRLIGCMMYLFGPPRQVKALTVRAGNGMDVTGTVLMGYEEMVGEILYSIVTDSSMGSQIEGEKGCMLIREIENVKDLQIVRRKIKQTIHFEQSDNTLNHQAGVFAAMIRTGAFQKEAADLSLQSVKVLEEVKKSVLL